MATYEQIDEFLGSDQWTPSEKWVIKWQFRLHGDFQTALAQAMSKADDANLARLAQVFPYEVAGFLAWNRGDLGDRLRKAGLEL